MQALAEQSDRFVRNVVTLTVEHSWDGRAVDMIDAGKRQAVKLAREF